MKKYALIAIGALFVSSSSTFAAGYGEAGCGLGSVLFGNKQGPVQILAFTTNRDPIISHQSFAISSGTSNCDTKGFDTATLEQERFVANNFESLAKEVAGGEGEQLTALAGLLGCSATEQQRFNTVAQQNYTTIFANDAVAADVLTAVKSIVSRDAGLSVACVN